MLEEFIVKLNDKNGLFYQKVKISDNIETEKETGFLYCKNSILGHVGVQAYNGYEVNMPDKKVVYVRRNAVDVFDEDSLASIEGKPVTLNHPDEMVTSKNFKKYTVGFVKNVRQDGDNIVGDLVINDMDAIEKVMSGELKDLSLGYTAKLVPTDEGDLIQKNIVANHVAIVGEGRAVNARIIDEQTVIEGSEDVGLFNKTPKPDEVVITDENIVEETPKEEIPVKDSVEVKTEPVVETEEKEEGENKVMKDFSYFLAKFNELKTLPKSEFRDAAFDTLNAECKEELKVELPEIVEIKDNALDKTLQTLADNTTVEDPKEVKKEANVVYAQDEERALANMYRKMNTDKVHARKLADTTYHDVIEMYENKKGGII